MGGLVTREWRLAHLGAGEAGAGGAIERLSAARIGGVLVITTHQLGSARLLALGLALGPLVAVSAGCTATVSAPGGGSTGSGASSSTGGTGSGGGQGGASAGSGGSGAGLSSSGGTGGGNATGGSSGASGTASGGTGVTLTGEASPVAMTGTPIYSRFLRLTNSQWENSVHDVLKLTAATGQSGQFLHAVAGTTDFDNNERVVVVNNDNWSDFQGAAEAVAAQVTGTDQALQAVVPTTDAATFIKTFGRRAFRRELTQAEVTSYTSLHSEGAMYSGTQSAFTKGAALVITAMLQSPNFLYRMEMGDDGAPLSGYEMAAKLSLWIRDTTPTDAMLDSAAKGSFDSADGAVAQAKTMLEDPAAVASIRQMHAQLYKTALFETITKDKVQGYSDGLKAEFTQAATSFFDYVYSQDLGVKDILTTNVGFAGPLMAPLYGVSVTGTAVKQVMLADRTGWYSQAPYLTLWAINNDPDSIHRGVRINFDTLCAELGPPATVLPSVPPLADNQSNRQRYEALTNGCGAPCHNIYINPIGFAFEDFDGVGRARTTDNGQPVDTTGTYPLAEGSTSFSNAAELMQSIAAGTQAHQCWSKKMAGYALERDLLDSERPLVESLGAVSLASGGSLKQVMAALVQNDAFRTHVGGGQ